MKTNTTRKHAPHRLPAPPEPSLKQLEYECFAAARELQSILEEESVILKRFGRAELLPLVSRKQFAVCELARRLDTLRPSHNGKFNLSDPLKQTLKKIHTMNLSNSHFIRYSLSLCQDMLSILCPAGYGPADGQNTMKAPKGRSFNMEV